MTLAVYPHAAPGIMPATMIAARIHAPGDVRLEPIAVPVPAAGEVLVRVAACGICGSDLGYIAKGSLDGVHPLTAPLPIGHEFAGTVVAVGEGVAGVAPGMRVAVNPDRAYIGGGGPDGAMAPYIRVSAAKIGDTLFPLPDHVTFAQAALAEPLSVALHGLRMVRATAADTVAILGAGPIGLCAVAMLQHLGARHIAIFDRVDSRLDRARALGADLAVNIERETLPAALARFHGAGDRFGVPFVGTDVFVDAAGSGPALAQVIGHAKKGARIAVIALHKAPLPIDLFHLMANEITLAGAIADDRAPEFAEAIAMIAANAAALGPLISHSFRFDQFAEALTVAADADQAAKVMLTFPDTAA
ncbi:zinc-binding dehydrogenase [Novosphingobium sp.]|uniref:zinc-dependent alcohol dehydrogenase n=1 Tax=Novosphingobium sp. TaxID=1874826 RepID=UPI00333E1AD1